MHTLLTFLLSAFSALVVGFIWYNPKVFGNIWMKEAGLSEEKVKGGNMIAILGMAFVYSFLISFVLQFLVIHQTGAESATVGIKGVDPSVLENYMKAYGTTYRSFKHGALHGFMTGLFFALPVIGTTSLFERRSWKYVLISGGYWIVACTLMGGIICQMK
ncbi:DUF1761 domain-containing protein [Flavobacterium sp. SUN046]|uniref:DUF1761 domain-containing protein n=1 Tax=Flavobacterium sp. SUN046 TaxID=3002440 RepID=UPI002DB8E08B|nr:DUF1761 domain-containing protein [Flavobacterium sp. SUN046]MEC4049621.1 DUF1761 domain-containing protein [Flavobacterium sp. SUN046]